MLQIGAAADEKAKALAKNKDMVMDASNPLFAAASASSAAVAAGGDVPDVSGHMTKSQRATLVLGRASAAPAAGRGRGRGRGKK